MVNDLDPEAGTFIPIESGDVGSASNLGPKPTALVQQYLLEHLPIYRELSEMKKDGWNDERGDAYFEKQPGFLR
ncbi:hypothetical protein B0T16DRAFT_490834 [Cercophora newfieldiana]|uniref:Uncharacterized protein n=1 Tax=Cercophora newfieldiana TaxID=92897 RepID=A0AA39YK95_9PEZI|nr:hypothetical protein B0T16DRAFT_490834 [Cercophora newfieldiana]